MIPEQLKERGVRFVLIEKGTKKPFQQGWQKKNIEFDDKELIEHLEKGGSYGVMGGGKKNLLLVDFDSLRVQEECLKVLPETFTVKTGSGLLHLYYYSNGDESFKIFDENMDTLADVQGEGKQVVGPGSIHPNGNKYEVIKDMPISFVEYSEVKAILVPYDKKPKKEVVQEKKEEYEGDEFLEKLKQKLTMKDLLDKLGVDIRLNPTQCPFHNSKGGKCLGYRNETSHCFHCNGSWNIFSMIKQLRNCSFKEAVKELVGHAGLEREYEEEKQKYFEKQKSQMKHEGKKVKLEYLELISGKNKDWGRATELLVEYIKSKKTMYTTKDDDKSEMWTYNEGIYLPQGKSEAKELLREVLEDCYSGFVYNQVINKIEPDTYIDMDHFFKINYKDELLLKNGILNIETLELKEYDPKKVFFTKLPVSYDPTQICPKIDSFLKEVLSKEEDIKVFYEILGFSLLKDYTYEKAFMFVGNGRNGKSKSIELVKRLVGAENCSSIPLVSLEPESFAISELFGKMVNLAGDIGNQDLKETSTFKQLTGRDLITGKRKFLKNIHFQNFAKMIFACNDLPMVYDMSKGFWERWILLEFPYYFADKEEYDKTPEEQRKNWRIKDNNIIEKITTDDELSGLLNQALLGLARLKMNNKFSSTQGSEEVKKTWIRKSNSFMAFCYDNLEESPDGIIGKKDLRKKYVEYCKRHKTPSKSDFVVKKVLEEMFGVGETRVNGLGDMYEQGWLGIKWKR